MSRWKQIALVVVLAIVAVLMLLYRLPGVADGFNQALNESFTREYNRAYNETIKQAGADKPVASKPESRTTAKTGGTGPVSASITPDTVTQLREQVRAQRLSEKSEHPIGDQLDWSFRDHTWHSVAQPSGGVLVRFTGLLGPDAAVDVRRSLADHLDTLRLSRQRRDALEEAISLVQAGLLLQLDFAFRPNSPQVYLERFRVEEEALVDAALPVNIWLERLLQ